MLSIFCTVESYTLTDEVRKGLVRYAEYKLGRVLLTQAEDAVQDALIQFLNDDSKTALRNSTLDEGSKAQARRCLYGKVNNRVKSIRRQAKRLETPHCCSTNKAPSKLSKLDANAVQDALNSLESSEQEVVYRVCLMGHSLRLVAHDLGMSLGRMWRKLVFAKSKLRKRLKTTEWARD